MKNFSELVRGDKVLVKTIDKGQLVKEEMVRCQYVEHVTKCWDGQYSVLILEKSYLPNDYKNDIIVNSDLWYAHVSYSNDGYVVISTNIE